MCYTTGCRSWSSQCVCVCVCVRACVRARMYLCECVCACVCACARVSKSIAVTSVRLSSIASQYCFETGRFLWLAVSFQLR